MLQLNSKLESIIKESPLYEPDKKIVFYRGDENPEFLIVGGVPNKEANEIGKPFIGESGDILNEWLFSKNITSFGVVNVCPLIPFPPNGEIRKPTEEELDYFNFLTDWVIEKVKPKFIITLGDGACYGVLGKKAKDAFLRPFKFQGIPTTSIYHPRFYSEKNELDRGIDDFSQAVEILRETAEQQPEIRMNFEAEVVEQEEPVEIKKKQRYFPLHMHTEYSIGDGANRTKELAKVLSEKGFLGAGVSDHGHLNGTFYFQKDLEELKLKSLLGVEMYIYDAEEFPKKEKKEKRGDEDKEVAEEEKKEKFHRHHITIYAKNQTGWKNLLELMWIASTEGFYYKPRILLKHLLERKEGLLILSGCMDGFLMHHVLKSEMGKATQYAQLFQMEFGEDYYVEMMPHHVIPGFKESQKIVYQIAKNLGIPVTVSLDCHYSCENDQKIHNAVLAINKRKKINDAKVGYTGNTYYLMEDHLLSAIMQKMGFQNDEVEEMFENSLAIADKCTFRIERFKSSDTMPYFKNSKETFQNLVMSEFEKRPFKSDPRYSNRLAMEMERMLSRGYDAYFLMVYDIIKTAKELGVMYGPGRGSVGGSLVAFLLGFHKADPIEHDLLFDRFISEDRKDLPDIDMDFQDSGRDKLIKKLIEKYGEDRVCGIIAFTKLHGKGTIRDIGRIYDVDRGSIERVAGLIVPKLAGEDRNELTLSDAFEGFEQGQQFKLRYPEAAEVCVGIEGRIRTNTRHAAGVIITRDPIRKYVPVYRVNGEIVTGWEKRALEEIGIVKLDVLGLKSLDIVSRCLAMTGEKIPEKWNDEKVFEQIFRNGNTSGVFQFESSGLSKYVGDLDCTDFKTLVDASALFRPGPLRSGLAATYQQRKIGIQDIGYLHPAVEEITKNTFGVIVYQEQVMQLFNKIGGFSWAVCEKLRKAISKSMGESIFAEMKQEFVAHATETLGMSQDLADDTFDKTTRFGCLTGDVVLYRASANQHKRKEILLKDAFEYQEAHNFKMRGLSVHSMSEDGFVRNNKIKRIWKTGRKEVFFIRTDFNKWIRASADHRFLVDGEWTMVKDMSVGNWIRTSNLVKPSKFYGEGFGSGSHNQPSPRFKKGVGFTNEEIFQKKKLVRKYLGKCQLCGSDKFIELHHIDESHLDNSDENTMLLCRKCHRIQSKNNPWVIGYPTQNERIAEIKAVGLRETYDVEMLDEPRNFIANGFVSHNSYGFNKAHSCTYSILSYTMAWIKTYHPEVFFSVLLDREGDPEQARVYVANAREMGVNVVPPDVNHSKAGYNVDVGAKTIFCGLKSVKGIGDAAVTKIIAGRPYQTLQDILKAVNKGVIKVLVQAGAMDEFIPSRKWAIENIDEICKLKAKLTEIPQKSPEYTPKELALMQNEVLDFYAEKHISTYFKDPFGKKPMYQKINDLTFAGYSNEVWIKGAVSSITFKQEGLEDREPLFVEGLLERKYAYMDVYDEGGGHIHVQVPPEMCTFYKRLLEKKKFPCILKGHTVPDIQKLYLDGIIDLEDPDKTNPIFEYVSGESTRKCRVIAQKLKTADRWGNYVGVLTSAAYRVKDGQAFVRMVFRDGKSFYTRDLQKGIVYVPGMVVKARVSGRGSLDGIEIF